MKFIPRITKSRIVTGLIAPWVMASLASTTAMAAAPEAPATPPPPLIPVEQPAATLIKQGEPPMPGLDQIRDGMLAEATRDLQKAAKYYEEAVLHYTSQRESAATASWRLAEVQRTLGKTNEAKVELTRLITNYPDQTNLVKSAAAALKLLEGAVQDSGERQTGGGSPMFKDPAMAARYGMVMTPTPAAPGATSIPASASGQNSSWRSTPAPTSTATPAANSTPAFMDPAMAARYGLAMPKQPNQAGQPPTPGPQQNPSQKSNAGQPQFYMDPALARRYGLVPATTRPAGAGMGPAPAAVQVQEASAGSTDFDPNDLPRPSTRTISRASTTTTELSGEEIEAMSSRIEFINNLNGQERLLALMEAFPDEYLSSLLDQQRKLRLKSINEEEGAGLDDSARKNLAARKEDQALRLEDEIKARMHEILTAKQLLIGMNRKPVKFNSSYAAGQKISAVETKEIENLEVILANSPDLINLVEAGGVARIHKAANNGWIVVADYLLANGASLHQTAENGFTPLHYAATQGHKAMTAFLLEKGARIDARSNSGMTPLYLASEKGFKSIVNLLLEKGATVKSTNDPMPALNVAAEKARPEIVQILLSKGADPNLRNIERGRTPLTSAVLGRNLQCVESLLAAGARINERDSEGNTALSLAVERRDANSIALTKLLLEKGADPKIPGRQGVLPIYNALEQSPGVEMLAALLEHGADPNLAFSAAEHPNPKQTEGFTPLHQAVNLSRIEHVELLLKKGANPNIKITSNGKYPFALTSNPRIQKLLIEHGFDLKRLEETAPGPGLRPPGAAGFLTTGEGVQVLPAVRPAQQTPPSAP